MKVALICSKSISKNALGGGLEQYLPDKTSHIVTAACFGLSVPVYEYCKSRFLPLTSLYAGADRDTPLSRRFAEALLDGADMLAAFAPDGAVPGFLLTYAVQLARDCEITTRVYHLKISKRKRLPHGGL